ncbi:hypothetical protein [Pseudoalteromonas rubra]|uniref:hypothetical protein n=1 Tax=Pseudoalteromonas rubra TaxID=43658 RepID=UPI002DBEBF96|nr:hypothetical protein [Pseudoalteromonas rubra]MEC4091136.1 hypothetical protein [Pseudoalteromonas rubra]
MNDLLFMIGDLVVLLNLLALLTHVFKGDGESNLWSLVTLCVFNGVMHGWGYYLKSKFGVFDDAIMRHLWYLSFALFYVLAMLFLLQMHKLKNVSATGFARLLGASFIIIGFVTLLDYVDHVLFGWDTPIVQKIYTYMIPYVNVCVAFSAVFVTIKDLLRKRSLKC